MMKQEYKYSTIARETAEKYKYPNFATETAFEYKYQIAMETALWNVYDYSRINFFFFFLLKQSECGEQSRGNGIEVIQGRNGPSLDRYLR